MMLGAFWILYYQVIWLGLSMVQVVPLFTYHQVKTFNFVEHDKTWYKKLVDILK
jgi:hypothetical protein